MSPPNTPGVPGMKLPPPVARAEDEPPHVRARVRTQTGMPAPQSERRPPMSNPPPPESYDQPQRERARSRHDFVIETDEDDRPSVVEFQREVRASAGSFSFAGPVWAFALFLVVGMLCAILYFTIRRQDAVPGNAATKDDVTALAARYESLHSDLAALAAKVNADSERQHNDMELLKLKVDVQRNK